MRQGTIVTWFTSPINQKNSTASNLIVFKLLQAPGYSQCIPQVWLVGWLEHEKKIKPY